MLLLNYQCLPKITNSTHLFFPYFFYIQDYDDDGDITNEMEIRQWKKKDVLARNCIMATITREMKQNLYTPGLNAAQMWTKLNLHYQLHTEEHLHLLWQNYYDFSYTAGDDMRTHIQKLSNTADKLKERDQPLSDIQLVSKALATLPETYRIVRSVWAAVPAADRTLDHLLQRLLCEESVVKSYQRTEAPTEEAFAAGGGGRGRGRGRGRGYLHGTRGGYVDKKSKGQYGADYDSRPRCGYCNKPGHEVKNCYKKHGYPGPKGDNTPGKALMSSSKSDPRSVHAFFADSGATKHMCDQKVFFVTFTPIEPGNRTVSGKYLARTTLLFSLNM
jgi:hypothetical protein